MCVYVTVPLCVRSMPASNFDPPNVPRSDQSGSDDIGLSRGSTQKLLWLWLGANVLGFAIATPLSFLMNLSAQTFEALYFAGLIVGAIVGSLQALIIKRQLPKLKSWQWILANIFGSYLGAWSGLFVIGIVWMMPPFARLLQFGGVFSLVITIAIYGAVIGAFVGAAQLFSLRQHTENLRQWWLANFLGRTLGWISASIVGWLITQAIDTKTFLVTWGALLGALGGAVYAGFTAKALLNLTPKPPQG